MYPLRRRQFMVTTQDGGVVTYTISGVVYDADGSTPVAGATVALGALTAESAADGTYTISSIPPDTEGSMTCTLAGYAWTSIAVAAMSGNLTAQNYTNVWWAAGGFGGDAVGVYRPVGAASLAASYVNLANPGTNDATVPVGQSAPTFDTSVGWTFNGSNQLLTTGITPTLDGTWSMFVRFNSVANNGVLGGCVESTNGTWRFYIWPYHTTNLVSYAHGANNILDQAPQVTTGSLCIAGKTAYRNGVADGTIAAGTGTATEAIAIGARRGLSSFLNLIAGNITEFAIYNDTLTEAAINIMLDAL